MENDKQVKSVLDKIQKLQALQQGAEAIGSLEEAANAAEKIQRLLLKFNLDLEEALKHKKDPGIVQAIFDAADQFGYSPKEGLWLPPLFTMVGKFFMCRVVHQRGEGKNIYVIIVGRKENIEIAANAINNLVSSIRFFAKKEWLRYQNYSDQKRGSFIRAYYQGAILGLSDSIRKIKEQRESMARANQEIIIDNTSLPMVLLNKVQENELNKVDEFMSENMDVKEKVHKVKPPTMGTLRGYERGKTLSPQGSLNTPNNGGKISN